MGVFAVRYAVLGVVNDVGKLRPSFFGVTNLERSGFEILEESASNVLPVVAKRLSEVDSGVCSREKKERLGLLWGLDALVLPKRWK